MLQKLQFCVDDGFISTALESRISIRELDICKRDLHRAKIASQNSIFQLLNNVKTARERFYDLQKGRILPENYEPLRQDVKKRRGRYRVIHMPRAANKALGHNRINLSEGLLPTAKISGEYKSGEETTRTLKLENQGWKKTSSISEVDPMRVGILWITVTSWNLKKAPKLKIVGGFFARLAKKVAPSRKSHPISQNC